VDGPEKGRNHHKAIVIKAAIVLTSFAFMAELNLSSKVDTESFTAVVSTGTVMEAPLYQ
jgi:hypothetical protein